jgi:hypothetical protein
MKKDWIEIRLSKVIDDVQCDVCDLTITATNRVFDEWSNELTEQDLLRILRNLDQGVYKLEIRNQ